MKEKRNGKAREAKSAAAEAASGLYAEDESWRKAIAEYKAGRISRAAMIRAVMKAAAPWDAPGREIIYVQAETMLGEHVCDWAIECEHGHQDVVDRWWLRPLKERGREYAPPAARERWERAAAEAEGISSRMLAGSREPATARARNR